ncbi:hypothetical protein KY285_023902 [Solanum tuberosum]|nr:hypothetical protein KY289_024233 [Solanum tuberosum]KAH0676101.1 hypothetical protein KY285_023902 [Solanum tuberosum]
MPLLRYQKEYLIWALKQEKSIATGGVLVNEMGMGKTQTSAMIQWVDEIDRFTTKGSTKILVYHCANQ